LKVSIFANYGIYQNRKKKIARKSLQKKQKREAWQKIKTCSETLQLIKTKSLPLKRTIPENHQDQGFYNDAIFFWNTTFRNW
jgi:hypothetical protein